MTQETKSSFIYFLKDPRTGLVRYVGYSSNPKQRLAAHICESRRVQKTHKQSWIFGLLKLGLRPEIFIVEETINPEEREIWWIAHLRLQGVNILNLTEGGDGVKNPSAEARRKASERMHKLMANPEHRAKLHTNEIRAMHSERFSQYMGLPEIRKRSSERMRKMNLDPAFKAKSHSPQNNHKASERLRILNQDESFRLKSRTPEILARRAERMRTNNPNRKSE